ncbi:multiple sugar transport system substrate-binding protein [Rhizobium azooxidifex]|uniref:Multiple sugar transport system substrate-binding protein n=1 Tax=Mycoplana azooxidifex TaxID=1636188 RepID=A0A7W6DD12_9HYPH|nr:extracellular solute-binding protein [Mycoplana azooxidifex]MBB3976679.1 multiple sugar transport system substrate-binding protein [Mycoplana azooxidifex]
MKTIPGSARQRWRLKLGAALLAVGFAATPVLAQEDVPDVGEQVPITALINASPWFSGFEAAVALYEEQTGNVVELDVTPYSGMLEKARNAVRGAESTHQLLNIDGGWTVEFYEAGTLTPLNEIDPEFKLPQEVFACGETHWWNAAKRWRTPDGGALYGVPPNCNTHMQVYRTDIFEQAKLTPPVTVDDVAVSCKAVQAASGLYGYVTRGERGSIRFEWSPYLLAHGADIAADMENGDYTVTINSPQALTALTKFLDILKGCGPDNVAALTQNDVIQLMAAGKAAEIQVVVAAMSSLTDPAKSVVAGKLGAVPNPIVDGRKLPSPIGNWSLAIPQNISKEQKEAALAFLKWFVSKPAQEAYVEAGGVPVRADVLEPLADQPDYFWVKAYLSNLDGAVSPFGYAEAAEVNEVLGLRLNQALIGELSPTAALNTAAAEIEAIFRKTGRKTGRLPDLAE